MEVNVFARRMTAAATAMAVGLNWSTGRYAVAVVVAVDARGATALVWSSSAAT